MSDTAGVVKEMVEMGKKKGATELPPPPGIMVYLHVVLKANPGAVKKMLEKGKQKVQDLEEVLKAVSLIVLLEARNEYLGEARDKVQVEDIGKAHGERTAWKKVIDLLKQGCTVEQLEQMKPPGGAPPQAG
jgi:hypothetical protein